MLPSGTRLRLKIPTVALVVDGKAKKVAEMVPGGATVELLDPVTEGNQLVLVRWSGHTCEMFSIDVRDRGEVIHN